MYVPAGAEEMTTEQVVETLETMPGVPRPPQRRAFPWLAAAGAGVGAAILWSAYKKRRRR